MATHQASTSPWGLPVPIVKRGLDGNTVFDANALKRLIDDYCDKQSKDDYTVVSIIGAQSSGKSTLMNAMFKTRFQMLDQQKDGRKATTEGIWAAVCSNARAIVFDIEGSDGLEHQDDLHARFENQSALFALGISDVVFFNINEKDIGRNHAASIPLLHTSFQEISNMWKTFNDAQGAETALLSERLNHRTDVTKLVIAVRDYNKKTACADILSKQILSTLDGVMGNEMPTISESFKPSVEFFPNLEYEEEAFKQKCEDMIPKFFNQGRQSKWQVNDIPTLGEKLWDGIRTNERLDIPSHQTMISKELCGAFKTGIISNLHTNQDYQSLTSKQNPSDFDKSLQKLLNEIKKQYDDKTQNHYGKIATDVKKTLENEIIQKVEPEFRSVMERFREAQLNEAANVILKICNEHVLNKKCHAESKVSKYIKKFNDETTGLSYDVYMYQNNFKRDIEVLGDALVDKAKRKLLFDILKGMSVLTAQTILGGGVAMGVALAGPQGLAALPSAIPVFTKLYQMGVKAMEESDADYIRSKDKVLSKVIGDKKGSGQVAHSGASSSSSK